jgi:uncharacterized RDD family membrane protein YckC
LLRRLGALFYDSLLLLGILFFATFALMPFRGEAFGPHSLAYQVYLLTVSFLFFGGFWTHGGQTLGMRAWKIGLRSADGGAVSWRQAGLRFLAALFSFALFGLGFFASLADPEKRCWHDRISGTRLSWQG